MQYRNEHRWTQNSIDAKKGGQNEFCIKQQTNLWQGHDKE